MTLQSAYWAYYYENRLFRYFGNFIPYIEIAAAFSKDTIEKKTKSNNRRADVISTQLSNCTRLVTGVAMPGYVLC